MENHDPAIDVGNPCQACGACCSYSSNWPRFTTEDDAALDLIPAKFVNEKLSGMRCDGDRCSALSGKSAWRRRAGFTQCGPKSAEPACPAMSSAKWREDGTACRFSARRRELIGDGLKLRSLHAVAAWAKSSSNSSSIGANVLSGLVESVIGLRLP